MADIVFLHTSPVHVATFGALLAELAPALAARHVVREDLLARARRDGVDDAGLKPLLRVALDEAAASARVVVCTCSTIGGLAEDAGATRVDRAMADEAVQRRSPVLMVAALQSTLQPTAALLQSSADRLGLPLVQRSLWVEAAWAHFEAGRHDDYVASLVEAVRRAARPGETIVLAQASMAPASDLLARHGLSALSSPRVGVEHAVRLCSAARPAPAT